MMQTNQSQKLIKSIFSPISDLFDLRQIEVHGLQGFIALLLWLTIISAPYFNLLVVQHKF